MMRSRWCGRLLPVACLAGFAGDGLSQSAIGLPGRGYPVGCSTAGLAVADVNGDGLCDVVTANGGKGSVSVLLGLPQKGLSTAQEYEVELWSQEVISADFDCDGHPDVAVSSSVDGGVATLLGNGLGALRACRCVALVEGVRSPVATDINADGNLDLVLASWEANELLVLEGDGRGGFEPLQPLTTGDGPWRAAAGDFDADGQADVVVLNRLSNGLSVFTHDTRGGLLGADESPVGESPSDFRVLDIDGDDTLDLVVTHYGDHNVVVYSGDGEGCFAETSKVATIVYPSALSDADVNGDGFQDLLVSGGFYPGVAVHLGTGLSFTAAEQLELPTHGAIGTCDAVGDAAIDLLVVAAMQVNVIEGQGNGTFLDMSLLPVAGGASAGATADMNGDGIRDLIVAGGMPCGIAVHLGQPGNSFVQMEQPCFFLGKPLSVAVGDIDGNGAQDVVLAAEESGVEIFVGDGAGGLYWSESQFPPGSTECCLLSDLDLDGDLDLVVTGGAGCFLSSSNGKGKFGDWYLVGPPANLGCAAVDDFDQDGYPDVVAASSGSTLGLVFGPGKYGPVETGSVAAGGYLDRLVCADLNQDGLPEVVGLDISSRRLETFSSRGEGEFGGAQDIEIPEFELVENIATGDLDSDGNVDVIALSNGQRTVLFRGDGELNLDLDDIGYLAAASDLLLVEDLDDNGRLDVVTGGAEAFYVSVAWNRKVAGWWFSYGIGKAGSQGVPKLEFGGSATIGGVAAIGVTNALPGVPSLLFIGTALNDQPFDGGSLLVGRAIQVLLPPFDWSGQQALYMLIPANPQLCGSTLYFQDMFVDPGADGFYQTAQTAGMGCLIRM